MHLYRASDLLVRHQQAIEQHLFTQALDLFAARPTVTLYDLTNTFLEGTGANIDKAKRGHSPAAPRLSLIDLGPGPGRERLRTQEQGLRGQCAGAPHARGDAGGTRFAGRQADLKGAPYDGRDPSNVMQKASGGPTEETVRRGSPARAP